MTIQTALVQGTKLLEDGVVSAPRLTAEVLLSHALHKERVFLYSHPEEELADVVWLHYGRYLHQRLQGKPTQYITKRQEFYGREFRVTPDVLIPRPETELVVEFALGFVKAGARVVDVGCGSGAIAVTVALERRCEVIASDISWDALRVARENAGRLGAAVQFVHTDLLLGFREGSIDLIISNPPYVPERDAGGLQREVRDFEPHVALFGGVGGNEVYERLIAQAEKVLRPGGGLVVELGYRSLDAVRAMLGTRWQDVSVSDDLAGIPRALGARWSP
jgi:release factor glutamine methyltransferase